MQPENNFHEICIPCNLQNCVKSHDWFSARHKFIVVCRSQVTLLQLVYRKDTKKKSKVSPCKKITTVLFPITIFFIISSWNGKSSPITWLTIKWGQQLKKSIFHYQLEERLRHRGTWQFAIKISLYLPNIFGKWKSFWVISQQQIERLTESRPFL